jgi:hypothetical protein
MLLKIAIILNFVVNLKYYIRKSQTYEALEMKLATDLSLYTMLFFEKKINLSSLIISFVGIFILIILVHFNVLKKILIFNKVKNFLSLKYNLSDISENLFIQILSDFINFIQIMLFLIILLINI